MKTLAVREENVMVARVQLHNMRQGHDEPIRNFCARTRSQASIYKLTIPCPNCATNVNYTDNKFSDVITRGLSDSEIQVDLLADKKQDKTLEEIVQFVENKETGKRSADRYFRNKGLKPLVVHTKSPTKPTKPAAPCNYCGTCGNGQNAPPRIRRNTCSAYGHTCESCGKPNHYQDVCRSKGKPKPRCPPTANITSSVGALFDNLCTTKTSLSDTHVIETPSYWTTTSPQMDTKSFTTATFPYCACHPSPR